jgi:hypothetical protein
MADLATPMAVRVAATLGIADHIARGLRTAPELAEVVNALWVRIFLIVVPLVVLLTLTTWGLERFLLSAGGQWSASIQAVTTTVLVAVTLAYVVLDP